MITPRMTIDTLSATMRDALIIAHNRGGVVRLSDTHGLTVRALDKRKLLTYSGKGVWVLTDHARKVAALLVSQAIIEAINSNRLPDEDPITGDWLSDIQFTPRNGAGAQRMPTGE